MSTTETTLQSGAVRRARDAKIKLWIELCGDFAERVERVRASEGRSRANLAMQALRVYVKQQETAPR